MEPHTKATLALPLASAVPQQQPHQPAPPSGHTTSTADRGSFCLAVCTCGWNGPARRSRDLARKDAARHTAG
ncbi:hypothetical protein J7E99_01470 [Streptomyces sp. ISL-44]|uniref:hypothetical protein n=1 Tax=Streptomyces sp. ISL-44 TaxID=2819184 RepID=UPI001BEB5A1A|nr:hypothetical protein [Streptomyces sp. ISL-44]MBT2539410.1 hypothetical protein [Streptomyces sp. ISL-44]